MNAFPAGRTVVVVVVVVVGAVGHDAMQPEHTRYTRRINETTELYYDDFDWIFQHRNPQ